MTGSEIIIRNLWKSYDGKSEVLKNVTLNIRRGEIVGLIGPNGTGKTTLIKALLGLLKIRGDISKDKELTVSAVMDRICLYKYLTAKDNLAFFGQLYNIGVEDSIERGREYLRYFRMEDILHKRIYRLSKGQQNIVNLVRALIVDPDLLIIDELNANLDPDRRFNVNELLCKINKEKKTIIVYSSHDLDDVGRISSRIIKLLDGCAVLDVNVEDIAKNDCYLIEGGEEKFNCAGFCDNLVRNYIYFGRKNDQNEYFLIFRRGRESDVKIKDIFNELKNARIVGPRRANIHDIYFSNYYAGDNIL